MIGQPGCGAACERLTARALRCARRALAVTWMLAVAKSRVGASENGSVVAVNLPDKVGDVGRWQAIAGAES